MGDGTTVPFVDSLRFEAGWVLFRPSFAGGYYYAVLTSAAQQPIIFSQQVPLGIIVVAHSVHHEKTRGN